MLRPALLAGAWYPGEPTACKNAIEEHARGDVPSTPGARGLIGPHAGWHYSGNAAAKAYRALAAAQPDADLVVIFGSHRGPFGPSTVLLQEGWQTPLGVLANARPLAERLREELELEEEPVRPRLADNAVELHLPFVRYFFPRAEIVMLGIEASERAIDIGRCAGELASEHRQAVFIGSTDLTHYGPNYENTAHGEGAEAVAWVRNTNDAGFLERLLANDARGVIAHATSEQSACCPGAVAAAMSAAAVAGPTAPRLIDHYLSCDVEPNDSFVGYAGVVL
jgi:MEMO1 family protein